ncbi:MAG: HTH domain-containing protein, partial [Candidatus Woesearchaeota archaeon]
MSEKQFQGFPPRENSQSYTGIPNIFFDREMKNMSSGERDIMLVLFRKIYGWVEEVVDGVPKYKREDEVSQSQFMEYLDCSRNTIRSSLQSLEKKGYIVKVRNYDAKTQRAATYSINIEGENKPLSKFDRGGLSKFDRGGLSKFDSTKESSFIEINNKNNNKKLKISKKIVDNFEKSFSKKPNNLQLEKIANYLINGISENLIIETINYCGLGGHNQSFCFQRLQMFLEDKIYTISQLEEKIKKPRLKRASGQNQNSKNNKDSESNYKWAD